MKTPIEKIQVLRQEELDKTSTTRQFPLGTQVKVVDESSATTSPYVAVYEYAQAGAAIQQYGAFALYNVAAFTSIAVGVSTSPGTAIGCFRYIIPQTDVASASYFWGCVKGICTGAVTYSGAGVGVIPGSQLKVVGDLTTLTVQTVSQASATAPSSIRQVQSVAFVSGLSATSANAVNIYLYGDVVQPNQIATWTADHTLL